MSTQRHTPECRKTTSSQSATAAGDDRSAARLTHELANLLDGAMRNVRLIAIDLDGPGYDQALRRRVDIANEGLTRMAMLLRRHQRARLGLRGFGGREQSLLDVVACACDLVRPRAEALKIALRFEVDARTRTLAAAELFPVFMNAITNAVESIESGISQSCDSPAGLVEITCRAVGDELEILIEDNGPGISAAVVDRTGAINLGTSTRPDGMGIGLALSHEIVTALGGGMSLRPRQPRGACFSVRIKLDALASQAG